MMAFRNIHPSIVALDLFESKRFIIFLGSAVTLIIMWQFGQKIFESPLFTIGQIAVIIVLFVLYFNGRRALFLFVLFLVAIEEHEMSSTFAYWNPQEAGTLLELRIAGIGIFDAITIIFLIPTIFREVARYIHGEKIISYRTDIFLIPFVIAYLLGMINGSFNAISSKHYFSELHDLLQIPAFYFIASRTLKSKRDVWILLKIILITFSVKTLIFIKRYLEGGGVYFGYDYYRVALGSDVPFMAFLALSLIVLYILMKDNPKIIRIIYFLGIGYSTILLVSAIGRSTYILSAISLVVIFYLLRKDIRLHHVLLSIGMMIFGGLIFVFVVLDEINRELISYALTTAFNWVEAIKFYGDLSLGERILEIVNVWESLVRDGAVWLGKGWGSIWKEIVYHHPFNKGSYPLEEQLSGIHTSTHIDAVYFLLKVGIVGTVLIYFSHVKYLLRAIKVYAQQKNWIDKSSTLMIITLMILFIPNYTYFGKLKLLLGIIYGCVAVYTHVSEKELCA